MSIPSQIHRFSAHVCMLLAGVVASTGAVASPPGDPHYVKAGFFDIHVCNWPDRPPFFLTVFSTRQYNDVEQIEVARPDGTRLGEFDLSRYRQIAKKGKPEKRAFLTQLPLNADDPDGWYEARILLKDGSVHHAKDYVLVSLMDRAKKMNPPHDAKNIAIPTVLTWNPIAGAKHYRVFIKDLWDDDKLILRSKLLDKPRLKIPPGLIRADGWYRWRVHTRDVNEHVLLGDFNHGSLSGYSSFTTAP